jgi:serine/threonine-protein kinase
MSEDKASGGTEPTGPGEPETQPSQSVPPTAEQPAVDDATIAGPPAEAGGTSVLPPVTDAPSPRWSARAQVRPAGLDRDEVPVEEWEQPGQPGPSLATPLLISLGVLLLLGLIAVGLWLLLRDRDAGPPPPVPTVTPGPTLTQTPTTQPTTPPATTTAATSVAPAPVEIPVLTGSTFDAAATALRDRGLRVQRRDQESTDVPEGQVIATDPPAGTLVVPGYPVTVIVSTGPPEPPPTTTTTTTEPPD